MSAKRKKIIEKFHLVGSHGVFYITSGNPKNQESGSFKGKVLMKYNKCTRMKEAFKYHKLPPHSK